MTGPRPRLLIATRSAHKLRELRELLAARAAELVSLDDLGVERRSGRGRARPSRRTPGSRPGSGSRRPGCRRSPTTPASRSTRSAADPGVRTRRYAGEDATDDDNNAKLLGALDGLPPERRGARYVCVAGAGAAAARSGHAAAVPITFARGTLPRPDRRGAARQRRVRLRPDLRAGRRAARRPDPRAVDAGREARHLASGRAARRMAPRLARARVLGPPVGSPAMCVPARLQQGVQALERPPLGPNTPSSRHVHVGKSSGCLLQAPSAVCQARIHRAACPRHASTAPPARAMSGPGLRARSSPSGSATVRARHPAPGRVEPPRPGSPPGPARAMRRSGCPRSAPAGAG